MIQRKHFSFSNIGLAIIVALTILTMASPVAKGYLIRGLMAIGSYKPDVTGYANHHKTYTNLPNYSYRDTSGNTVSLSDLKNKVVFVNYWATWCPPCLAEMPSINKLRQKFRNNPQVVFVMVDVDDDFAKSKAFLKKNDYDLPLYNSVSTFPDALLDGSIPTTLVFGKDGSLKYKHTGPTNYNDESFEEYLKGQAK
ncbi:TlpA family protein disulfide reductase [Mucilaginibacter dorajii]|uniref:TlpA disulfide reductase family protein n=1 Tax=Mucilaginibacter dorajii TaxID=692994 RepID=A0ABP7QQD3_9SPHI|nr:TlpA disulfide reductase family protein [Mucilaginibacter dorajii]MCS3733860.1 thiol-disulfide isomerase/thioredoxin [Mucilaginibacter dorajii]